MKRTRGNRASELALAESVAGKRDGAIAAGTRDLPDLDLGLSRSSNTYKRP